MSSNESLLTVYRITLNNLVPINIKKMVLFYISNLFYNAFITFKHKFLFIIRR